jgi:hypothetical protein
MSKNIVDANYRFISASQEVNARITQRQQALTLYVTLTVSLLAALVALKPSGAVSDPLPIEWLVLGFPVASTSLAFLDYKSERAITNLRRFLAELEKLDNAHTHMPSYNTDPKWAMGANKARRFHDYAAAVLVTGGNAIGLGAFVSIYPEQVAEHPAMIFIAIAAAIGSLVALLWIPKWSYIPSEVRRDTY